MDASEVVQVVAGAAHGEYVRKMAEHSSGLGRAAAVIAGTIDDLAQAGARQSEQFGELSGEVLAMRTANEGILAATTETERVVDRTATDQALVRVNPLQLRSRNSRSLRPNAPKPITGSMIVADHCHRVVSGA